VPDETRSIVSELLKEARQSARRAKKVEEALKILEKEDSGVSDLAGAARCIAERGGTDERWVAVRKEAERRLERARIKAGMRLTSALEAAGAEAGYELHKLSDRPLVLQLGELSVECDLSTNSAQLLFGREVAREGLECEAREVLKARSEVLDLHASWSANDGELFGRILAGYRMLLLREGSTQGERVSLVDLLIPLSFLTSEPKAWRADGPRGLAPHSAHRLAFELSRLRRSGLLEHDGLRLDLGVATGGSTANKRDVLFVPTSGAEGQYYGSIRFVEATGRAEGES